MFLPLRGINCVERKIREVFLSMVKYTQPADQGYLFPLACVSREDNYA
jgi:hypothetical protein